MTVLQYNTVPAEHQPLVAEPKKKTGGRVVAAAVAAALIATAVAAKTPSVFRAALVVEKDSFRAFGAPGAPLRTQSDATFLLLPRVHATLADHVINGVALFPGVGYVEIAASSVMVRGFDEDAAFAAAFAAAASFWWRKIAGFASSADAAPPAASSAGASALAKCSRALAAMRLLTSQRSATGVWVYGSMVWI